jgi:hypothetical protein
MTEQRPDGGDLAYDEETGPGDSGSDETVSGDTMSHESGRLSTRGTGETAGYVGGRAMGDGGAAGMRQIQADDAAADDETDANFAQGDL